MTVFTNGDEWDEWACRWCYRCAHLDKCPLILAAIIDDAPPAEWVPTGSGDYRCTRHTPSPPPPPGPPGWTFKTAGAG
jgi:hypothetical protein